MNNTGKQRNAKPVLVFTRRKTGDPPQQRGGARREGTRNPLEFTIESIQSVCNMPQSKAAQELSISVTTLKQVCRRLGLRRWPYRRGQSSFYDDEQRYDDEACGILVPFARGANGSSMALPDRNSAPFPENVVQADFFRQHAQLPSLHRANQAPPEVSMATSSSGVACPNEDSAHSVHEDDLAFLTSVLTDDVAQEERVKLHDGSTNHFFTGMSQYQCAGGWSQTSSSFGISKLDKHVFKRHTTSPPTHESSSFDCPVFDGTCAESMARVDAPPYLHTLRGSSTSHPRSSMQDEYAAYAWRASSSFSSSFATSPSTYEQRDTL